MAKCFKKKCVCHGTPILIQKVRWKEKRRRGGSMDLLCAEIFSAGYFYIPYIPLLTPVEV